MANTKKKTKPAKVILILSVLVFVGLLGFYIKTRIDNRPITESKREKYQSEMILKEQEGNK